MQVSNLGQRLSHTCLVLRMPFLSTQGGDAERTGIHCFYGLTRAKHVCWTQGPHHSPCPLLQCHRMPLSPPCLFAPTQAIFSAWKVPQFFFIWLIFRPRLKCQFFREAFLTFKYKLPDLKKKSYWVHITTFLTSSYWQFIQCLPSLLDYIFF